MLIKSALRDWLSVSYGMIRILRIGSLRSPPPIRLRRTSPYSGGRTTRALHWATYEKIASRSFVVPPLFRGQNNLSMLTYRDISDTRQRSSLYPPIKKFSNVMGSLFPRSHFSLFLFFPAAIGVLPCVFYLSIYLFPSSFNLLYHLTGFRNSCTLSHRWRNFKFPSSKWTWLARASGIPGISDALSVGGEAFRGTGFPAFFSHENDFKS